MNRYFVAEGYEKSTISNCFRHQYMKTTFLSCHRCLANTGAEKNEQDFNIYCNFYQQMSLSKSKC